MKTTGIGIFTKMGIVSAVVLAGLGGYIYFLGNTINPETSLLNKIELGMKNFNSIGEKKHYSFDAQGEITIEKSFQTVFSGAMSAKNISLLSNNNSLYQRISADEIEVKNNQNTGVIQNLDIVSHNAKNYIYAEKIENIFDIQLEKYKDIFEKGKYVLIDNELNIQKKFENIDTNTILYQLLVASSTSNPQQYLKNIEFRKLLLQEIYSDQWIVYLLEETQKVEDKQYFQISQNICRDSENIINSLGKKSQIFLPENCNFILDEINKSVNNGKNVFIQGDKNKGNFTFNISFDTDVYFVAEYKNHILYNWELQSKKPEIFIDIKGNKNIISQSVIQLNIQKDENNFISGEIRDGSGKISFQSNQGTLQSTGEIEFLDYQMMKYSAKGEGKKLSNRFVFSAEGNDHSGAISYEEKSSQKEIGKIELKYNGLNHNFSLQSENLNISSVLKNKNFSLSLEEKDYQQELLTQAKIVHNNHVISGFIKTPDIDITLEGTTTNHAIEILKAQGNIFGHEILYILENQGAGTPNQKISAGATVDSQRFFDIILEKNIKKDQQDLDNINTRFTFDVPFLEFKANGNFELQEKITNIDYSIPEKYESVENNSSEFFVLPDIFKTFDKKYYFLPEVGIIGSSIAGIGGYLEDLENKKIRRNYQRQENVQQIFGLIEAYILDNKISPVEIIGEKTENKDNKIRFAGEKISYGENYSVGYLSDKILENINISGDFDPKDYRVGFVKNDIKTVIQVATFLEDKTGYKKLFINGNYSPRKIVRYDFENYTSDQQDVEEENQAIKSKISINGFHHLQSGDMTNIGKIVEVKDDFIGIDREIRNGATKVFLLGDDSPTLFHDENGKVLDKGQIFSQGE